MKRFLTLLAFVALIITANAAVIQSGSCGDNVTFVLNDDGTLVISGSGDMKNYTYVYSSSSSSAPWYDNRSKIIKAQIEDGVTSIGNLAFYGCSDLTSVTIPNSVTSIGDAAFQYCSGLTSITIPNSVTSIGHSAFSGCSGLTSVTIGNSVTSIGERAFYNCSALTSITIPNSVTWIGSYAFRDCSGLTSITIPNSVTSIGYEAFYGCSGLTSVTIPNSVMSIGDRAFSGCSGLTSVTIPNSVTSIGAGAFRGCSGLTSIMVEKGNPNYDCRDNCNAIIETSTNTLLFGCYITIIPNSVTSIGNLAFYGCKGLTSITIPNSVTGIGEHAFYKCSGLTSITIPNSVTSIGNWAFYECSGLTSITIPNSVTSIGDGAFSDCSRLTSVTIPNSVTSIGGGAFEGCSGLTSITIPNSVTSIGNYAFDSCNNIRTVYWNTNCQYSFNAKYINELYYGDDITTVYKLLKENYTSSLRKVVIGKNVEYIRQDAFKGAPLKEFYITGEKDIYLYPGVFDNVNVGNCTLYVPKSRAEYYETTAPWKDFGKIVDLDGNEFPEITKKQCEAPSVVYTDGHLKFSSTTPNATYSYTITDNDIKTSLTKSTTGDIPLSTTYNITVYAEAEGYDTSNATTKTLQFGGNSGTEDVDALKEQIKSLQTQNSALESKVSKFMTENESLVKEISTLEETNSALESENSTLKTENESLTKENSALESKNNELASEVSDLKDDVKTLESENSALESENTNLKETIKKYAEGDLNLDGRTNIDDVVYLLKLDSYSSDTDALALLLDGSTAITLSEITDKYGDVEFYTLNGVKVNIPNQTGIYIVKKNGETKMVVVKK